MSNALFRHTALLVLGGAALLLGACSDPATAATNGESDANVEQDSELEDTATDEDTGSTQDSGTKDTGSKDTGTVVTDTAPADTAPAGYDYGKTPIDESCYAPGNFANFPDVQASPDGTKIVFQRCDTARSIVLRDLGSTTASVISSGSSFFLAGSHGVLAAKGSATERTPWTSGSTLSLPVTIGAADAWRVWQSSSALKFANKAAGTTSSKEKLVFYASGSTTGVESAEYDVTKSTIASVVFSADGTKVASLERYPSELVSRLRVASPTAGASVTTYNLGLFEPRWVKGGQIGSGALFLSGMNGTQRASKLYWVDFSTGGVQQLSTTDVIPRMPPADDDVPAVAIVGNRVFFLTGAVSSVGSSPVGKSVTVRSWDVTTPTVAPTTLVTINDAQIYDLAKYTTQKQSMLVSADGTHLLLNLVAKSGTIFGNAWAAVPVAGGTPKFVAATSDIAVGAPNRVGVSNPSETDTKFIEVATSTTTSMTRGTPLFSPSGDTFFTSVAVKNSDASYAFTVRRKAGSAAESTIVSLKTYSVPRPLAVQSSSVLLRLERGPAVSGSETKYDLYLFP